MRQPDYTWLGDILISARHVRNFVAGVDRDEFDGNIMRRSAIIHHLMIIGEATKQVSDPFRAAHPDIPWRRMAGMRDRLIHDYRQVDPGHRVEHRDGDDPRSDPAGGAAGSAHGRMTLPRFVTK